MLTVPLYHNQAPGSLPPDTDRDSPAARHQPTLDVIPHPDGGRRGIVVVCPGGGYGHRAAHEGIPVATRMHRLGLHGAVLNYRHAPWRDPVPHDDAARALRLVRHHSDDWQIDPSHVGILGFSAGGHLAASLAVANDSGTPHAEDPIERQSSRPDAAILAYPVLSFGAWRHEGSRANLLGDTRRPADEARLSCERQVTAATPPCFLWHTADDGPVSVMNSLRFAAACQQHGVPLGLHVFPHGRHGVGLAEEHSDIGVWPDLLGAWLQRIGWPSPGQTSP